MALAVGQIVLGLVAPALFAATPQIPPVSATHGHYVVLGSVNGVTVANARLIIDAGYACPQIEGGAAPIPMTSRDNPHLFPVIVCEAVVKFGRTLHITLQDRSLALPTVKTDPTRIVVFGDTGCKGYSAKSNTGCQPGTPAQPFASLAAAAAVGPTPDVVLHMGDYNYRGTSSHILFTVEQEGKTTQVAEWTYDAGDGTGAAEGCEQGEGATFWSQNAVNSNLPDTWAAWRDDFFRPARDLLAKAPWVLARGNHELCSRAGPGWFYFLDPSSNLTGQQLSCPTPVASAGALPNVVLPEPYAVDLGSLKLLVLDSANACDSFTDPTFNARYAKQFARLGAMAAGSETAWVMTHRPIWGVTGYSSTESTGCTSANQWGCINQTLQAGLKEGLDGAFPPAVKLFLAGHMHRFQSVTFDDGRPPVVVVGTGGVALDPSPPLGTVSVAVDGAKARTLTTGADVTSSGSKLPAFGYLDITYSPDGTWSGTIHSPPEELTLADCGSKQ
ncbi:MAG: metallophosphoesterase, partial [Acidobacteriota bacterium]